MGQAKGGKKLRRGSRHANMYQAQFLRTAENKRTRQARIRRRLAEMPKQIGRVKLDKATRIIRRNVREHQKNLCKHQARATTQTIHIKQLELKGTV